MYLGGGGLMFMGRGVNISDRGGECCGEGVYIYLYYILDGGRTNGRVSTYTGGCTR